MKKKRCKTKRRVKKVKKCAYCGRKITKYEYYKNEGYCNQCEVEHGWDENYGY